MNTGCEIHSSTQPNSETHCLHISMCVLMTEHVTLIARHSPTANKTSVDVICVLANVNMELTGRHAIRNKTCK